MAEHTRSGWSSISTPTDTISVSVPIGPDTLSGTTVTTEWGTTSGYGNIALSNDAIEIVDENEIEVIDEETQKEIDKIGTPGKRNIEDLLKSFKVEKNPELKKSAAEQLSDSSWLTDTFTLGSTIDSPDIPTIELGT